MLEGQSHVKCDVQKLPLRISRQKKKGGCDPQQQNVCCSIAM